MSPKLLVPYTDVNIFTHGHSCDLCGLSNFPLAKDYNQVFYNEAAYAHGNAVLVLYTAMKNLYLNMCIQELSASLQFAKALNSATIWTCTYIADYKVHNNDPSMERERERTEASN